MIGYGTSARRRDNSDGKVRDHGDNAKPTSVRTQSARHPIKTVAPHRH